MSLIEKKKLEELKTSRKREQLIAANKAAAASILLAIQLQLSRSCSSIERKH
jgi:hypothetical protein